MKNPMLVVVTACALMGSATFANAYQHCTFVNGKSECYFPPIGTIKGPKMHPIPDLPTDGEGGQVGDVSMSTSMATAEVAYFEIRDVNGDQFVIALMDPQKISEARRIIAEASGEHVMGYVVPRKASYNPAWDYELLPDSIEFFKYSTEVCDATIAMVNDNLTSIGLAFLPGNEWCPWTSELVREIPPPAGR